MWKSIRTSCHLGVRVGRVRIDERPADAPLGIIKPTCRAWILKQWYSKLDQTTGQGKPNSSGSSAANQRTPRRVQ